MAKNKNGCLIIINNQYYYVIMIINNNSNFQYNKTKHWWLGGWTGWCSKSKIQNINISNITKLVCT